jgi:hypothetical protein
MVDGIKRVHRSVLLPYRQARHGKLRYQGESNILIVKGYEKKLTVFLVTVKIG